MGKSKKFPVFLKTKQTIEKWVSIILMFKRDKYASTFRIFCFRQNFNNNNTYRHLVPRKLKVKNSRKFNTKLFINISTSVKKTI